MAKIANKSVSETGVTIDFIDGGKALNCPLKALPKSIIHQLALHGLSQKVGDSYSGAESVEEARVLAEGVFENLKAGSWAVRASRGGKFVEALVRATDKEYGECLTAWNAMSKEEQKTLKAHPAIKKAIAEIDLERAKVAASVDTTDAPSLSALLQPQAS